MAKAGRLRVPVKLEAAGDTHIGGRTHNEDAILLRPDLNLFLVADGAGGQNAGNVAASLAITTIAHFFEQTHEAADSLPEIDGLGLYTAARRLAAAVQEANREILEIAKTSDKHRGMGTTIVAALFDVEHRSLHVAYVGDSRCYRLRDGRLEQLTHDHSLINDVLELRPNISDERVKKLPQNVITRALGMMDNLRVSVRSHEVSHDDRYLLCSDGLSDNVDEEQILESLALDIPCDEQVELLVSMALEAGASDNVAAIIVDCALPQSATSARASTRPIKKTHRKSSRPKLPRVLLRNTVTEESVPEIVLYDRPEARDSSPLIHVVPAASGSPDVMEAFHVVLAEDEQVTKEYRAPSVEVADPTGGEPPMRGARAGAGLEPPATPPSAAAATGAVEASTPSTAAKKTTARRGVAPPRPPTPKTGDIADDPTLEPPTKVVPREAAVAAGRAATANARARGGLRPPPRPKPGDERPRTTLAPGAAATRERPADATERGGAAAIPLSERDKAVSAPRVNKAQSADDLVEPRTGDTKAPPGASETPPSFDSTPPDRPSPEPLAPMPPDIVGGRLESQKPTPAAGSKVGRLLPGAAKRRPLSDSRRTLPGLHDDKEPATEHGPTEHGPTDHDSLPVPPVREPFDTSDFTNDSIPCHVCGSIIMRTADLCMYCGAPTGFVIAKKD